MANVAFNFTSYQLPSFSLFLPLQPRFVRHPDLRHVRTVN